MIEQEVTEFGSYLRQWQENLSTQPAGELFSQPDRVALISVDLIKGFTDMGPLSSPRVKGILPAAAELFTLAHQKGVHALAFAQDTHEPDAKEFSAWPAHAVKGTVESETSDELKVLPFFNEISIFEKNSINSAEFTGLDAWVAARPALDTFVVVGDCTDLCVYQLAMHLLTQANARQIERRVIVPANAVETYDLPTTRALKAGAHPHPGDLMHSLFLNHMQLNGVEIVKEIA
jgi:nicotinamidase-related amidase